MHILSAGAHDTLRNQGSESRNDLALLTALPVTTPAKPAR